jgi:ABC-type bacteriocin/lantibiotic exporter with double-glycine peptidase domain
MAEHVSVLEPLKKLMRIVKIEKDDIGRVYLYALFAGFINLSMPLGVQSIINFIQSGQISTSWIVLVIFVMAGLVFAGVLQLFQMYIIEKMSQRLFANAAFEVAWKLPQLRLSSINNLHVPEVVNRFFDVMTLQKGMSKILMEFTAAFLQVLFGLILLSLYHPLFIGFSFFIVLFFIAVYRYTIPRGLQTNLKESSYKYKTVYWLQEVGEALLSFKLAGTTRLHLDRTDELVSQYVEARSAHFRVLATQYVFSVILKILIAGGLLIAGSLLVLNNQMNLGQFVAAEIIILLISTSIDKLITGLETVYDVLTAAEKIDQLAGLPVDEKPAVEITRPLAIGGVDVEIKNACLHYKEASRESVSGIELRAKPGERVVIAGWKGSGRQALMQLIAGTYPPTSGTVNYDGIPARNLNPETVRNITGVFFQDEVIFHGTIAENISLGRPGIGFPEVEKAIHKVGLMHWVTSQPDGYQTFLNPDGYKLDSTTRNKILLARAIAGSPRLLLLEFPTENLNAADCTLICNLIYDRSEPWTVLALTSSREMANAADRIVILNEGRIFANGTPKELSKEDWYGTLFHS